MVTEIKRCKRGGPVQMNYYYLFIYLVLLLLLLLLLLLFLAVVIIIIIPYSRRSEYDVYSERHRFFDMALFCMSPEHKLRRICTLILTAQAV